MMFYSYFYERKSDESIALISTNPSINYFLWTTTDLLLGKLLLADKHCFLRCWWMFLILLLAKLFNREICVFFGVLGFADVVPFLVWIFSVFFFISSPIFMWSKMRMISFVIAFLSIEPYWKFSSNLLSYFYFFYVLAERGIFFYFAGGFLRWLEIMEITTLDETELLLDFFLILSKVELSFFYGFRK